MFALFAFSNAAFTTVPFESIWMTMIHLCLLYTKDIWVQENKMDMRQKFRNNTEVVCQMTQILSEKSTRIDHFKVN